MTPATAGADAGSRPTAEEARAWIGHQVDHVGGGAVGRVDGVVVDAESGEAEWLVVRVGRLGHRTLLPARHAAAAAGRVWAPYSRDAIRGAPRGDGSRDLSRADEEHLLEHYGIGARAAGRAAELASRAADAVTARPVS